MAQKVITTLVDDLDGNVIEDGKGETIRFAIDGTSYEIDLTDDNATKLRESLAPFVENGRRKTLSSNRASTSRASSASGNRNDKQELAAAREWLRSQGHQVSDRGRVPVNLMELFRSQNR